MSRNNLYFLIITSLLLGCEQNSAKKSIINLASKNDSCSINFDIDTIRFNSKLTACQKRQVFLRMNFEEDFSKIIDTNRVALRFIWWRSFHGLTIIRLENRPTVVIEEGKENKPKVWQEWFATYKTDIGSLNNDFSVFAKGKSSGKIPPFVFEQHVEKLPVNQTPAIIQELSSIRFWNMQPVYHAPEHTDGSYWTLQVYQKGKYHEVSTDMQSHAIKTICLQLLKLSKHPATAAQIY